MNTNIRNIKKNTLMALVLALLSISFGCTKKISDPHNSPDEMIDSQVIKYLALGDSYTIGEGVEEPMRWPVQLGLRLDSLDYDVEQVKIIAQTGWTTNDLKNAIDNSEIGDYNLVSLLIGVNNQYQHLSFELFENEFDMLLDSSIKFAQKKERVFVVSIPDYGVTPFGSGQSESIGKDINRYNEYIASRCDTEGIPFINITEISRNLGDNEDALASDKLHPSGSQYSAWVREIYPVVLGLLDN